MRVEGELKVEYGVDTGAVEYGVGTGGNSGRARVGVVT